MVFIIELLGRECRKYASFSALYNEIYSKNRLSPDFHMSGMTSIPAKANYMPLIMSLTFLRGTGGFLPVKLLVMMAGTLLIEIWLVS